MNITNLSNEWIVDCKLNLDDLHNDSIRIPELHSKYMNYFNVEKDNNRKLQKEKKITYSKLLKYYTGQIDGKDINRPPCQFKPQTKSQIEKIIENDQELIDVDDRLEQSNDKILFLKEIITALNNRNFVIKNAIDYMKWSNGN